MKGMDPLFLVSCFIAGLLLGAVYFAALFQAIRLQAAQDNRVAQGDRLIAIPLHLGRLGAAVAAFWLAAQQGAWAILLVLLGFLCARHVFQHFIGKQ